MRVEHRELVPVILEKPDERVDLELVAVRRLEGILASVVLLGDAVAERDDPAALVRRVVPRVCPQPGGDRRRDPHQGTSSAIPSPPQKGAERSFQPPSASTATTVDPSGSSPAIRRATWTTAPDDTPANSPSWSSSARAAAAASAFDTSSLRSSFATSSTGGT